MANENEVRDIVTRHQNQKYLSSVLARDISVLVELAEEWLAAGKGLPIKKFHLEPCYYHRKKYQHDCNCGASDFNEALDACRLAVAKFYVEKDRLLTEEEISYAINIAFEANLKMSASVLAAQQAKIEERKCSSL